jgi:hypothetical protein
MSKNVAKIEEPGAALTPMDLLQIATEKGADVAQLKELMALQKEWEAHEARKVYVAAMARFRDSCPTIDKDSAAHNSKYASLAGTLEQIRDLLSECGLSHSWKTDQHEGVVSVTCCVTHVGGHQECTTMMAAPDTSGSKNDIQAIGSTVTYLERYTLFAVLGLASKEQDNDGNVPDDPIDSERVEGLQKLADETGSDVPKLCKVFKVGSLAELKQSDYYRAVGMMEEKRKRK